jgi:hypothetical protein
MSPWCLMPVRTIDEIEFLPTPGGGSWAEVEEAKTVSGNGGR